MARRALCLILIFIQLTPAWAANPPMHASLRPLGIQRVGKLAPSNEAAYHLLEKRVQRWVENMDEAGLEVRRMAQPMDVEGLLIEEAKSNLIRNSEKLRRLLSVGKDAGDSGKVLLNSIHLSRQQLSGFSKNGPILQRALMIEGAYLWKMGRVREMKEVLRRAMRMHPTLKTEGVGGWDTLPSAAFDSAAFDAVLDSVQREVKRNCKVVVSVTPSLAKLTVNGFEVGNGKQVSLSGNAIHHFNFTAAGYAEREELVRCERLGSRRLEVVLEKVPGVKTSSQEQSRILIQPSKDQFRLFLYTPERGMDEFPLNKPIRVAELLLENGEAEIPVATDAAISLFQKHKLAFNPALPKLNSVGTTHWVNGGMHENSTEAQLGKSHWYTSPVFWGIVGGVVAGGAITYFATRVGGPDATESGAGALRRR